MKKKILLIEDDERLQKLLESELGDEGYEAFIAAEGKEALDILKNQEYKPDLIILDLRMPKMDGLETMGHMIKSHLNVPVIIHSAYSSYKDDAMALAADAYVVKSHDLTELKATIKNLIGGE